ncbi:glycosyltransferase family 9 protein [Flavobacterium sp. MAH-1]|uniref:Glycosyltransferase family 9 protein n=1 Tax=Flavobacterium agri TaxID=2743471 RepID=A0A7Y8Y071_9FLAO|nr:glycosyltransferase family 9 protein [Flavobacterium agri]NUY80154.1 glycosyltransferase family 9 protein [Flavobacterium agri]NYA70179.1 glycosyltransferase family 9 protein [Flavobacterium agri]
MGDVAMTVPVLRALVKQHPEVKITMVSRAFLAPFFDGIPNVEFFAVDLKGRHKGILGLARLYSDLKKRKVDALADLHNVLRSKIVRSFFVGSGKPVAKIDKGRAEKKALTRAENKIFKPLKSTFERYADVFRELGFPMDLSNPEFPKTPELASEVKAITGEKASKWIGIAPFAAHQGKQYPLDLMAEVVSKLSENTDNKIFLFGAGTDEIKTLESLKSDSQNVIVIAGKLKLSQELNLIANLDVMLSMDSGNAHMAAMFGIPAVTLWGATHPFAGFAPFNQPDSNLIVSDREKFPLLPTSVYGNKIVEGYQDAMRTISPETVVEKINSVIA